MTHAARIIGYLMLLVGMAIYVRHGGGSFWTALCGAAGVTFGLQLLHWSFHAKDGGRQ